MLAGARCHLRSQKLEIPPVLSLIRPVLKQKREGSYGLGVELEDGKQIPFSQFCRRPGPYFDFVNGLIEESQKSSKCCQFEQGSMMNTKLLIRSLSSMIGDEYMYPETLRLHQLT